MDNQHQLLLAWIMYSDDNQGKLVPNVSTSSGAFGTAPSWDGIGNIMNWSGTNPYNTNGMALVTNNAGLLGSYISRNYRVFKCPGDTVPAPNGPRVRSLSMNSMMNGYSSTAQYLNGNKTDNYGNNTPQPGAYRLFKRRTPLSIHGLPVRGCS